MKPFDRILFPFDFSEAAEAMAAAVAAMARRFNASVTVVNAFNLVHDYNLAPSFDAFDGSDPSPVPYTTAFQELRLERERKLQDILRTRLPNIDGKAVLVDGEPALAVEWLARREKTDLIMMPSKGLGKFRRMLLGSITAKVLHDLDCPVFTSAHDPRQGMASPFRCQSILCAVKFHPAHEALLRMTATLARVFNARVCLLHVYSKDDEQNRVETMNSIRRTFEQVSEAEENLNIPARERIMDAAIPESIRQAAIEEDADLVIVGRGCERETVSFIWSHLYSIIRESPCPVLSV